MTSKNLCFVSGATEPYFGMAGMLAASLELHYPEVPFRLLDFGLTPAQCTFAHEKGWLIPMPPGLSAELHPFALKAELSRYLDQEPDRPLIWLDCDMIAVGGDGRDFECLLDMMKADGQTLAACRDHGVQSIADFLARYPSPALEKEASPEDRHAPYLNIGIAIFRDRAFLKGWPEASKRHEAADDICFEQNALNVWVRRNPDRFRELDAKRWNVHSSLLKQIAPAADGWRCGGEAVRILHATSPGGAEHDEDVITLTVESSSFPAVIKWFRDERLRTLQAEYLRSFLLDNVEALRSHGVMTPSTSRSM